MSIPRRPIPRAGPIMVLALIAALEGLGLLAYAVFDVVEAGRQGATGPSDVSNAPGIAVLIAIQIAFGGGLLWVARGWWKCRAWARAPFLVAQIMAVLIGYELAQSLGTIERVVGIGLAVVAVGGLVLVFTRPVMRALEP